MASDLFHGDQFFESLIETGSRCVGEDLRSLCLRGPEKRLRQSRLLQPLMVAVSLGYLHRLQDRGIAPGWVLGHSLGEITALAAGGVVSAEQAVEIATSRGRFMEEAASTLNGGMVAVIGHHRESLEKLLADSSGDGPVTLANDNAPNQVVLSGEQSALEAMSRRIAAEKLGACRSIPVSGPWHSSCMAPARDKFAQWVAAQPFGKPAVPIVMNVTGLPEDSPERIRQNVIMGITEPVRWRSAMAYLKENGAKTLIQVGPGRVLTGLARANGFGDETRVLAVSSLRDVDAVAGSLS